MFLIILTVFLQLLNVLNAENKVCSEAEGGYRNSYETYRATMEVWVPDRSCTGSDCKKVKRVYTYIAGHNVTKFVTSLKLSCCSGYERDTTYSTLVCKPKCSKVCIHGECKGPEKCLCYKGYTLDPANQYNCLPHCSTPCGRNGTCVAPDKCQCDRGYRTNKNGTCEPVCNPPCVNSLCVAPDTCKRCTDGCDHGTCVDNVCVCDRGWKISGDKTCQPVCSSTCINSNCVEPEHCQCLKGYVKSSTNSCKPYCSGGCPHGSCVAPETCVCDAGWQMVQSPSKVKSCQPICSKPCVNGTCVAPDTCECLPGYEKSDVNNICVPYCSDSCQNGTCVSPHTCLCYPGWEMRPTHDIMNETCVPVCSKPCVNGTCVSPDTCECLDGYVESETNVCKPHCENGCPNGTCVEPGSCVCDSGWYKTSNGTCMKDETSKDKSKGVESKGSSAWVYVLVTLLIAVLVAALVVYFRRVRRYQTLEDDGTVILPSQEGNTSTLLHRHRGSYDITKNSEL
ncbi:hypothetical protein B5X24_HaOG214257 [Helicoverpa armigera]|nr:hypothetical protein B5X24_HaOG214257 [Helicoverpa armigera]